MQFSRRSFFRLSLERLSLLAVSSQVAACTAYDSAKGIAFLRPKEVSVVGALVETIAPPAGLNIRAEDLTVVHRIDRFLETGDPMTAEQFRNLLLGIEHYPQLFTTYFRRFTHLPVPGRADVLEGFASSRFFAKRMIFTAVKAVVCNHYYSDPLVRQALGYQPVCEF